MLCDSAGCGVKFGLFAWKYSCGMCKKHFCSTHILDRNKAESWNLYSFFSGEGACAECRAKLESILAASHGIEVWSANYKGRISCDREGPSHYVSTGTHRERTTCDHYLRVEAAHQGMEVVYNVTYDKDTEQDGNYRYTVWSARGTAARKLPRRGDMEGYSGQEKTLRLYVGNLSYATTEDHLRQAFASYGVASVRIVMDRVQGGSRGFGFVETKTASGAERAIREMNGSLLDGRSIVVNVSNT